MRNKSIGASLETLKKKAVTVQNGMQIFFPQFSKTEELQISNLQIEPKTYAYNNSVVAFVDEDRTFRVIPDFKGTQKTLAENGYRKAYFYVPFSNWDYPIAYKEYWKSLWKIKNAEK